MRKHYDFSDAVKNPHAGKFKDGYEKQGTVAKQPLYY